MRLMRTPPSASASVRTGEDRLIVKTPENEQSRPLEAEASCATVLKFRVWFGPCKLGEESVPPRTLTCHKEGHICFVLYSSHVRGGVRRLPAKKTTGALRGRHLTCALTFFFFLLSKLHCATCTRTHARPPARGHVHSCADRWRETQGWMKNRRALLQEKEKSLQKVDSVGSWTACRLASWHCFTGVTN